MHATWIIVFALIAVGNAFDDYEEMRTAILIPRNQVLVTRDDMPYDSYPSRILKRTTAIDDGFTKRATSSDRLAAIPRSGLMISGRGWMPGFVDQPRIFKRALPLEKIILRS